MPKLDCSVSLLYGHEPCQHYLDWQLGKHGIQIVFNDPSTGQERFATFLPEIAPREGMSKPEAIDSLIRKSGVKGDITESLRECLFVTRYQSTICGLSYSSYLRWKDHGKDESTESCCMLPAAS